MSPQKNLLVVNRQVSFLGLGEHGLSLRNHPFFRFEGRRTDHPPRPNVQKCQHEFDPLSADFDLDGDGDGDDLTLWETGFGKMTGAMRGDGDEIGDADVDGRDFLAWQRQFGTNALLTASSSAAVPEPATFACLLLGFVVTTFFREWSRSIGHA